MTRQEATYALREELQKHGLTNWSVRLNQNIDSHFLGLCSYKDRCIILSAHHIDIHPTPSVLNTIRHEVAHALTPHHGHDEVWAAKAKEIGCDNTLPCSNLSLSPEIIDAIRSGATIEVTFDEHVVRVPKYNITRLEDKCDVCGKVAVTKSEKIIPIADETSPDLKFITLECGHTLMKKLPKGTPFHMMQYGGDPNCKHDWVKNYCTKCDRKRPFNFQLEGMRFGEAALSVNNGVGFFDEMGLGKTIQALGVVLFNKTLWPCLWIVKSGLKYQFSSAIMDWMGDSHVPQIVTSSNDYLIPKMKHYIVGYDMLVQKTRTLKSGKIVKQGFDIEQFNRVGIKCVVLDECQQVKNVDSSRTQMVRNVVKGRKVIALSGTPWKNRGSELYPVLSMLNNAKFPSEKQFRSQWVATYWQGAFQKEGGIRNIPRFKEYTKDILIRRERVEVMPELPLVNRTKLHVRMNPAEEEAYDILVEEFVKWYEDNVARLTGLAIIAAMQKMRHLVALAKLPATFEYIDEFVEANDRKLVVFAHHIDVQEHLFLELTERYGKDKKDSQGNITEKGIPVYRLIGGMNPLKKHEAQEAFNHAPRALMVASELSAGEGLNLQTCSDCLMHERQWNPANEEQCEGRFIRIGSTAEVVNAIYAHLEGMTTIDPQLDQINERKRTQFHEGMNKTEAPKWNEDAMLKDLAAVIVAAHKRKKAA